MRGADAARQRRKGTKALDTTFQNVHNSHMTTISVTNARNHLSGVLERVRQGETLLITDHSRPIARIEPIPLVGAGADARRLNDLERMGTLRRGSPDPRAAWLKEAPPRASKPIRITEIMRHERESSR